MLGVNAQEEEDSPAPDPRRSSRRDTRERGGARGREAKLISGRGGGRSAADAITLSDTEDSDAEEGGDRKEGGLSRSGGSGGLDLGADAITVSDSEDSKEEEGGGGRGSHGESEGGGDSDEGLDLAKVVEEFKGLRLQGLPGGMSRSGGGGGRSATEEEEAEERRRRRRRRSEEEEAGCFVDENFDPNFLSQFYADRAGAGTIDNPGSKACRHLVKHASG